MLLLNIQVYARECEYDSFAEESYLLIIEQPTDAALWQLSNEGFTNTQETFVYKKTGSRNFNSLNDVCINAKSL